jgi:hypothetical protein
MEINQGDLLVVCFNMAEVVGKSNAKSPAEVPGCERASTDARRTPGEHDGYGVNSWLLSKAKWPDFGRNWQ